MVLSWRWWFRGALLRCYCGGGGAAAAGAAGAAGAADAAGAAGAAGAGAGISYAR